MTLLGDESRPGGVTFCFTERTGGVSSSPWTSLNLGENCGDDPVCVERNRQLALRALCADDLFDRLLKPNQVHGDRVIEVTSSSDESLDAARAACLEGADAIVCTARDVPVLLCYADCVPVVLCAPQGFAVIHSGWKGTYAAIAAKACARLCALLGCEPAQVSAYLGPHVTGEDYEVSAELLSRFAAEFGSIVDCGENRLDLAAAITSSLVDAGVLPDHILDCGISTASTTDRFYSYRAEEGTCGRHGALAYLPSA